MLKKTKQTLLIYLLSLALLISNFAFLGLSSQVVAEEAENTSDLVVENDQTTDNSPNTGDTTTDELEEASVEGAEPQTVDTAGESELPADELVATDNLVDSPRTEKQEGASEQKANDTSEEEATQNNVTEEVADSSSPDTVDEEDQPVVSNRVQSQASDRRSEDQDQSAANASAETQTSEKATNPDRALVIISKNQDGSTDWLKEDETTINNGKENKPVFVYENTGSNYKTTEEEELAKLAAELNNGQPLWQEGENAPVQVSYKLRFNAENIPQYQIVSKDNPDQVLRDWTNWEDQAGRNHAYELKVKYEGANEPTTHKLSYANRLEDTKQDKQGNTALEDTYYVGNGTDLNFLIQLDPSAGLENGSEEIPTDLTVTLKGSVHPQYQYIKLGSFSYNNQKYEWELVPSEGGTLQYQSKGVKLGGYGAASFALDISELQGALGDNLQIEVASTRTVNGEEKTNTLSRNFVLTESTYSDPEVKLNGSTSKEDESGNHTSVPAHYAGAVDSEGKITNKDALTLVTDLVLKNNEGKWFDQDGKELTSLLRADKAANPDIQELTIELELPYDEVSKTYAQYDPAALPDNLRWEEIEESQDGKVVKKLRLHLVSEAIEGSGLTYEQTAAGYNLKLGELELDKAKLTNVVLKDGKNMVFLDKAGKSYQVKEEFYQELENSNWKLDSKAGKLTYVGPQDPESQPETTSYDIVDGKIKHGDDFYNLSLEQKEKENEKGEKIVHYIANFAKVKNSEDAKKFQQIGENYFSYKNSFVQGLGHVVNELKTIKEQEGEEDKTKWEANPVLDVALATMDKVYNIILDKTEKDLGHYGGTIYGNEVVDGKDGHQYLKVVDQYGRPKDFVAKETKNEGKSVWEFFKTPSGDSAVYEKIEHDYNKVLVDAENALIFDAHHKILARRELTESVLNTAKTTGNRVLEFADAPYEIILDKYYYDEADKQFHSITKDQEDKGFVKNGIFYEDYAEVGKLITVERQIVEDKDHKVLKEVRQGVTTHDEGFPTYLGSTSQDDYFQVGNSVYVHKEIDSQHVLTKIGSWNDENKKFTDTLLAEDLNQADTRQQNCNYLASGDLKLTRQSWGKNDENWLSLGNQKVYEAFREKGDQLGLKFAGFHTGKDNQYNLKADFQYKISSQPGKVQERSAETAFTLQQTHKAEGNQGFVKNPPAIFSGDKQINNEVLNLIFRSTTDRDRDAILGRLFTKDADTTLTTAEQNFKKLFVEEYKKFFHKDFNLEAFQEEIPGRMLEWRLHLYNHTPERYEQDNRAAIVFEDTHLDNRLVYESLTFNLDHETTKQLLANAKNDQERKAIEAVKNVAYLGDVQALSLGVDFTEKGGAFTSVSGYTFKGEDLLKLASEAWAKLKDDSHDNKRFVDVEKILGQGREAEFTLGNSKDTQKKYSLTLDRALGQAIVNVRNFFIDKYEVEGEADSFAYKSPIQIAYQAEVERIGEKLKELEAKRNDPDQTLTDEELEDEMLKILNATDNANLKTCITRSFTAFKDSQKDILEAYQENVDKLSLDAKGLKDLDRAKEHDNRIYNAIRVRMKDGFSVADKRYPDVGSVDLIINSTLADNVDIPFTDAYGNALTNKSTLLYKETLKQIADLVNKGDDYKEFQGKRWEEIKNSSNIELFEELWQTAETKAVTNLAGDKALVSGTKLNAEDGLTYRSYINPKPGTAEGATNLYTPASGKDLKPEDLAGYTLILENGQLKLSQDFMKTPKGNPVNPYYLSLDEKDNLQAFYDKVNDKHGTNLQADDILINLGAYYINESGYNSQPFANKAREYLYWNPSKEIWEIPGTKTSCPPGLYLCKPPTEGSSGSNSQEGGQDIKFAESKFVITATEEVRTYNPGSDKIEKTKNNNGVLDLTKPDQEADTVDFTIKVSLDAPSWEEAMRALVDRISRTTKYDNLTEDPEYQEGKKLIDVRYGKDGNHADTATIQQDALVVDIMPQDLDTSAMQLDLDVVKSVYETTNDAEKYADFVDGIELVYFEGKLSDYLAKLQAESSEQDKRRQARLEAFKKEYETKSGEDLSKLAKKFVFVWLPEFQAPNNSQNLLQLKLKNIKADKDAVLGTNKNRTNFSSDYWSGYDFEEFEIKDKGGQFDKEMRLWDVPLDTEGNPLADAQAEIVNGAQNEGWFKGTAKLKFGQKFDYRISWSTKTNAGETGGVSSFYDKFDLKDQLPQMGEDTPNNFRPYVIGPIQVQDNQNTKGLKVILTLQDGQQYEQVEEVDAGGQVTYTYKELTTGAESPASSEFYKQVVSVDLSYDSKNVAGKQFNPNVGVQLIIPMQTPEFETVAEDGVIKLDHKDFDLVDYLNGKVLQAENTASAKNGGESSNTVKTKLDELVLAAHKLWEKDGQILSGEQLKGLPAVKFDVYQHAYKVTFKLDDQGQVLLDDKGQPVLDMENVVAEPLGGKPHQTIELNAANSYKALVRSLPEQYKNLVYRIDEEGKTRLNPEESYIYFYRYELVEQAIKGWQGQISAPIVNASPTDGENADTGNAVPSRQFELNLQQVIQFQNPEYALSEDGKFIIRYQNDQGNWVDPYSPVQLTKNTENPEEPEEPEKPQEPETPPFPDRPPRTPEEETPQSPAGSADQQAPPIISKAFVQKLPKTASAMPQAGPNQAQAASKKQKTEAQQGHKPEAVIAQPASKASDRLPNLAVLQSA